MALLAGTNPRRESACLPVGFVISLVMSGKNAREEYRQKVCKGGVALRPASALSHDLSSHRMTGVAAAQVIGMVSYMNRRKISADLVYSANADTERSAAPPSQLGRRSNGTGDRVAAA